MMLSETSSIEVLPFPPLYEAGLAAILPFPLLYVTGLAGILLLIFPDGADFAFTLPFTFP